MILQLRSLPPFLSPKYDLKKHPNYRYTAEFDKKKNIFRLESLFRHLLRLKPEDEYTVYEVEETDTDEEADLLNFNDLDSDRLNISNPICGRQTTLFLQGRRRATCKVKMQS